MPWDGTELCVAGLGLDADGAPVLRGDALVVAGGPEESVVQPEWSSDGVAVVLLGPVGLVEPPPGRSTRAAPGPDGVARVGRRRSRPRSAGPAGSAGCAGTPAWATAGSSPRPPPRRRPAWCWSTRPRPARAAGARRPRRRRLAGHRREPGRGRARAVAGRRGGGLGHRRAHARPARPPAGGRRPGSDGGRGRRAVPTAAVDAASTSLRRLDAAAPAATRRWPDDIAGARADHLPQRRRADGPRPALPARPAPPSSAPTASGRRWS